MAGRGGLNLTNNDPADVFLSRYREAAARLAPQLQALDATALRQWCEGLGIETFVGSSGRVFPTTMKASPLLRAWLQRLGDRGVRLALRHEWTGWTEAGLLQFRTSSGETTVQANATVLALGGATWRRLGSDGGWAEPLRERGIPVAPFAPANCGAQVNWSPHFRERFAGTPLKRITLHIGGHSAKGELVITEDGLEGGALYHLGPELRAALGQSGEATLELDLKPDLDAQTLREKLARPRGRQSLANHIRKTTRLPPAAIGLLNEATLASDRRPSDLTPAELAGRIKCLPLAATATASLDKAISTAGGIAWSALDEHLMLKDAPGVFAAGEMLDWEAPTGGYLLQACFATGRAAGLGALAWLDAQRP